MDIHELITLDANSKVRITSDGYLVAAPRVARTGIQLYRGDEVGKPDMKVVRVYRPSAEVFNKDSLASYTHRPLTNDHPADMVDATNWKDLAVGMTGDEVVRDGEFVRIPLVFMDAAAIKDIRGGKAQLSLGYTTDLAFQAGKTPGGEDYDAIQTSIRANHLALVRQARGGDQLRVGDEDPHMDLKTIVVDRIPVQVADTSAPVIERFLEQRDALSKADKDKITELQAEIDKIKAKAAGDAATLAADHKKATDTKDAEIATLKTQLVAATLTPQKLDSLVKDRALVVGKAKTILGDKVVVDGKTEAEIRKQVVSAKLGDTAKDWSDDMITASFNTLTADTKVSHGADPLAGRLADAAGGGRDQRDAAYIERESHLNNAWRNQPASKSN